jgi:hypothetical protein
MSIHLRYLFGTIIRMINQHELPMPILNNFLVAALSYSQNELSLPSVHLVVESTYVGQLITFVQLECVLIFNESSCADCFVSSECVSAG